MILLIILAVITIVLIIVISKYQKNKKMLLNAFKRGNVIVYGKKGKGKDLLFQYIINSRKKIYLSNVDYGGGYNSVSISEINCKPNTYETLINEEYTKIENKGWEDKDIYLSDCGIYLPSQFDSSLYKKFPSFPIYYALSRHLYHNNVHCNTQNLTRVWKALREQADSYVKCQGVINLPGLLIIKWCYYDKYESAVNNILPIITPRKWLRRKDDSIIAQFKATNGEIKNGVSIIRKKAIKYDTRVFRTYLLEEEKK